MAASLAHQEANNRAAMDQDVDQERDVIISYYPEFSILTRAAVAVLLMSPAEELDQTVERTRMLLELAMATYQDWLRHPLRADLRVDLSSPESRAR